MNANQVLEQAKSLGKDEITQDLAEQTFVRLAIVEQVLGLPSDRSTTISQRVDSALSAIQSLERLYSTPLKEGASFAEMKVYHEQQAQVIGKLDALQLACSSTVAGAVTSLKVLDEFRKKAQAVIDQWVKETNERLDTIPIKEIVASTPKLAQEIEIIDIPHEASPVSLFRLKSHPEIAFPIWPLSKDNSGTRGRISIRVSESNAKTGATTTDSGGVSTEIVKDFRSVCACCVSELIGESPYNASRPKWSKDNEAERKAWLESPDGIADARWRSDRHLAFIIALKEACETNGIRVIASRRPELWVKWFPEEMSGITVVCTGGEPEAIYETHLQGRHAKDFSKGGVFELSVYGARG